MNNLDDLKAIWHSAQTDSLPTSDAMISMIKEFRTQKLRKKWMVIIASCLLFSLMISVLCTASFIVMTTYIGGGMIALSCLLLAIINVRSLKRFNQLGECSNLEFLSFVAQTRQNQIYYYKKTQVVLMLFSSLGLVLYLYETSLMSAIASLVIYALCVVYLIFMWLYVRPHYFRKNTEELNETISRLNNISKQLQHDEK